MSCADKTHCHFHEVHVSSHIPCLVNINAIHSKGFDNLWGSGPHKRPFSRYEKVGSIKHFLFNKPMSSWHDTAHMLYFEKRQWCVFLIEGVKARVRSSEWWNGSCTLNGRPLTCSNSMLVWNHKYKSHNFPFNIWWFLELFSIRLFEKAFSFWCSCLL